MFKAFKSQNQSNEERLDELLSAYLDGMLAPEERAMLEARLRQEPALQKRLEALRLTVNALKHLPVVEAPRNFILSPSMVAPARPASRRRRRRSWQAFGWATAVAAVLFLLVFAGDVFVVAPGLRSEPMDVLVEEPGERVSRAAPASGEVLKQVGAEAEVVVTEEADRMMAEAEVTSPEAAQPEEEAPVEMAEAAALVGEETPTAEGVERGAEAEAPAAEDVYQGTATPMVVATPTGEGEAAEPRAAAPWATATAGQFPTALPEPTVTTEEGIARDAPPTFTPIPAAAEEASEGVPVWLRLVEIGLGLMVIGLATTTLILRWRSV
jgi:anti-sigma factor RsiW